MLWSGLIIPVIGIFLVFFSLVKLKVFTITKLLFTRQKDSHCSIILPILKIQIQIEIRTRRTA